MLVCLYNFLVQLFIEDGWRHQVKRVFLLIAPNYNWNMFGELSAVKGWNFSWIINHQTSSDSITKLPGTFIAVEAAQSFGQVTGDRWQVTYDIKQPFSSYYFWYTSRESVSPLCGILHMTYDIWYQTTVFFKFFGIHQEIQCLPYARFKKNENNLIEKKLIAGQIV